MFDIEKILILKNNSINKKERILIRSFFIGSAKNQKAKNK